MKRALTLGLIATGTALALTLGGLGGAGAGGSGLDEEDNHDEGTPFFGFVKDLDAGGKALPDAKVTAEIKGGTASFVMRADAQGHFRFSGFDKSIDPNNVEISCSREGYRLERTVRRRLSKDAGGPVEVDCLMVKQ